ncbi:ATP-binding protein [Diaphorobacter aerolatus]|uniref:ATP-binding protein n=1 Tax=Diaphorobacter aerolatus TaxID=1288495 RepID=UPI001D01EC1C|nr:ATP-binding protein [Diaphorobacter aerolatus]
MAEQNLLELPADGFETARSSYLLQDLHLYNWGAFQGWHVASLDARNTAIVGPTGSGKTTVIDALMTLLCTNPKYNLASTGGHESDRDLVSYVRGVSGPGTEGSSDHISRTGKTVTGIAARMVKNANEQVWLGALFWFEGSSSSTTDLQRRWIFSHNADHQSLNLWLEEHHRGGARALSKLEKNTEGLHVHTAKSAYLAKLQSHFEVGANAFTLLNRAAGLKQLNSIDEIFRELVLEDQSAFEDALKVATDFDELTSIHAELETARHQHLSLLPLREQDRRYVEQGERLQAMQNQQEALPAWFAEQGQALWGIRIDELQARLATLGGHISTAESMVESARQEEELCFASYQKTGGSDIQMLERLIGIAKNTLATREQRERDYRRIIQSLSLVAPDVLNAEVLAEQQRRAEALGEEMAQQLKDHETLLEAAIAEEHNARSDVTRLQQEHEQTLKSPGSNIPPQFQRFRADLANQLEWPIEELPFVAELIEVQKKQNDWRGAIERALGSQRLRILVPPDAMRSALHWVNQRHNQLHVRLLEVRTVDTPVRFRVDGFCAKLNIKSHAYDGALRELLHAHDLRCVDSIEELQSTPHAMTREGSMSGKARYFDKQDQKRLDADWMTGFDNNDRLSMLREQRLHAQGRLSACESRKADAQAVKGNLVALRALCLQLIDLKFETVDAEGARQALALEQQRLDALLRPDSDTARAKQLWEHAGALTATNRQALMNLRKEEAVVQSDVQRAVDTQMRYARRQREAQAQSVSVAEDFSAAYLPLTCESLDERERQALRQVQAQVDTESQSLSRITNQITRQMAVAKEANRGFLADEMAELDSMPAFLSRLRVLEEEALPRSGNGFRPI